MTDTTSKIREHYQASGLTERIKGILATIAPEDKKLSIGELAALDQFHTRGILATAELADSARLASSDRVLDLGCGVGGPARYIASQFGAKVTGIDLSPGFVDVAAYLTERCGLSDRARFLVGDAIHSQFEDSAFDVVFLQHVAMNIEDRDALYSEVHRILTPGGRFAIYDIVRLRHDVIYPVPWARDASTSFLLSEPETRTALEHAGFNADVWRDDTPAAAEWFKAATGGSPPGALNLGVVMGPDFRDRTANLGRNLRENRLGVLFAVLQRN